MSGKRKRVVLSLGDKVKILKRLKNGEAGTKLAVEFGVGKSTISDIKKNEESIMKYVTGLESEQGSLDRKSMKKSFDDKVDKALHMWFLQKRSSGHPISGPLICEKAIFFNEKLNGENTNAFQASSGWLRNFKLRHGIREIGLHGEKLSASTEAATKFVKEFIEFVESEKYEEEFIYNADETGLFWRSLPRKSLASGFEKSASATKLNKERITILNCANATGNHRIPLFVIGQSKKPRSFKNWKNLPVIYTSQRKAWMTSEVFIDWYDHTFIPKVKTHQEDMKKEGRVLLLLDNAPSHPCADTLERENGKFRVKFLPPNVTSLIQPMDQSVIETFKRIYRKQMLRKMLLSEDTEEPDSQNAIKINLKDCCIMAADSWKLVKSSTLKNAWNKILNREKSDTGAEASDKENEECKTIKEMGRILNYEEKEINEWINCDMQDPGYQILNDNEIVVEIEGENEENENEIENECSENDPGPSHSEAFECLETAMKWLERQKDADPIQAMHLRSIRDMAALKRMSSLKQEKIKSFFT